MAVRDEGERRRVAAAVPQGRYARLWKSLVAGCIPSRTEDVALWYRAAQHVIGPVLHDAQVERMLCDDEVQHEQDEAQTAA